LEGRGGPAVATAAAHLSGLDRVFLRRACELAERGRGSTAPNPAVGAVIALGARTLGEGFHRVRGAEHAEAAALADAKAHDLTVSGATLYVSLEPCDHVGLTPACSAAIVDAGIARVVIGALDPNPRTAAGGVARLQAAGIAVDVADDAWSRDVIEEFAASVARPRPYVRLKMAASLDGFVAPRMGERRWLTGGETRDYVRELRARYDAVLVGAGTVRVDDPQLTVRPPRARRKPFVRVVVCEDAAVPATRAIFAPVEGYAPTVVLAPAGKRAAFVALETHADVLYVGDDGAQTLDLAAALEALQRRGISSVLCEGGPTLAARLLAGGLVDRVDWLVAPEFLGAPGAVAALTAGPGELHLRFERFERLGPDLLISAVVLREDAREAECSAV
jgi:diaminohydroxyphosphoribosylaminopyrimidine deaminase/5-amino-6-(5-phosphoribosylamino)uracil reductase